jgi:DNA modification methylase
MEIEQYSVNRLIPYGEELKKNKKVVDVMVRAITEYGFRVPVLIRGDGAVVDGNLRLKAAKILKMDKVPVIRVDDLEEMQVKAFRISINKISELADWDEKVLKKEMQFLSKAGYDLDAIGFTNDELERLLFKENDGNKKPEKIPAIPDSPVSISGDLWLLDKHRLLCGDATDDESMYRLMFGNVADLIVTDPPYNVNYEGRRTQREKIKNDNQPEEEFYNFLYKSFTLMCEMLIKGGGVYIAHAEAGRVGIIFRHAFLEAGFKLASCLIWRKNHFVISRNDYHWQHEPILYGWKEGGTHKFYGGRDKTTIKDLNGLEAMRMVDDNEIEFNVGGQIYLVRGDNIMVEELLTTVIDCKKPVASKLHPTMKPVALIEKFLNNSSRHGQIVLDPFGGGGSTMIACERNGRMCRMMELDPIYIDVIISRWEEYTGLKALHEHGKTFEEITKERRG